MEEKKSIKKCLEKIFKDMYCGEKFNGLWLHKEVAKLNSDYTFTYPDTILRVARKYFRNQFRIVDRRKSLYERI